jgi:hypothetical protein
MADRPEPNRALRVARLNSHVNEMAERSVNHELAYRRSLEEEFRMAKRLGIEPAPMRPDPYTDQEKRVINREVTV